VIARRAFLAALGGSLAVPLAAGAQAPLDRVARIGYLTLDLKGADPRPLEAFRQGLRDLGYVEGKNLQIEYRDAEGKPERLRPLAAELIALKVDVIVATSGTAGAQAAKRATTTVSIVFPAVADPVMDGLVTSFARPGGNLTGSSLVAPELVAKSLELLKEAVPGASRVALLLNPDSLSDQGRKERLAGANTAARTLGIRLQIVEARRPEDFDRAFSEMTKARAEALSVLAAPVFDNNRRRVVDLAANRRLPAVYAFRWYVEAGGLISYGPDLIESFRRAGTYVDKILKGANPGDIPVERPTKFELLVNLKTARRLGLTMPPSLLQRADQVIE